MALASRTILALIILLASSRLEADTPLGVGDAGEKLVQQERAWQIGLIVHAGLSSGSSFEPIALSPDAIYGAAPKLELAVVHGSKRISGFSGGSSPSGLCVTGSSAGCPRLYNGPSILARYQLLDGGFSLVADGGLITVSLYDPFAVSAKLGFIARAKLGPLAIWTNPNIRVGLTSRTISEGGADVAFNRERLNAPLSISFAATEALSVGVETGIRGFTEGFSDNFEVPIWLAIHLGLTATMGVGVAGGLETLIDHGTDGATSVTTDFRSISFFFVSRI